MCRAICAMSVALMFALAAMLTGCGTSWPVYDTSSADYDRASAFDLCATDAPNELMRANTASASELRHQALTRLRARNPRSSGAAELITRTLPEAQGGVPYMALWALYEGEEALFVVEAIGPAEGTLSDKRLWVLSTTGDVLLSGVR